MELNLRQQKVVNAKDKNILCLATAAAGKSHVLVERVKRLLSEGAEPSKIVCITFTNQAADEMKERLGEKAKQVFVGTVHSYAKRLCDLNGVDVSDDIATEKFDNILKKATIIPWAKYPAVDFLFVDEFQDTSPSQYSFLRRIPAQSRYYTGDERQFIFDFTNSTDKYIREIAEDPEFTNYFLTQNYRNPPNILKFADSFLHTMNKISPTSVAEIQEDGFLDDSSSFYEVAEEFTWDENYGKWYVLCRTNVEAEAVQLYLNSLEEPVPNVFIKAGDLELPQIREVMARNVVKIMTIHASKGREFPNVVVVGAMRYSESERRVSYVAATRAMKSLYWCPAIKIPKQLKKSKKGVQVKTKKAEIVQF